MKTTAWEATQLSEVASIPSVGGGGGGRGDARNDSVIKNTQVCSHNIYVHHGSGA